MGSKCQPRARGGRGTSLEVKFPRFKVSPAHAGVEGTGWERLIVGARQPRARGGRGREQVLAVYGPLSAPRTRG